MDSFAFSLLQECQQNQFTEELNREEEEDHKPIPVPSHERAKEIIMRISNTIKGFFCNFRTM